MNDNAIYLITKALERVLERSITFTPACDLGSQKLRELGVSSLQLFEFVSVLEEIGQFTFDDADIDYENFSTVGRVIVLISPYLQTHERGR